MSLYVKHAFTQPITDLVDTQTCANIFSSSEAILRWFLPLYLDFCDVFDFDCSRERGCGFDDNCLFEEDCVVDVLSGPGRYRCQGRTAKTAFFLPGQTHNA